VTMQPAMVGRARRGISASSSRAVPAPLPFELAATSPKPRAAAHPALDGRPRGHTAREAATALERGVAHRSRARRVHLFIGGRASACGKSVQRVIGGVEINCGTCARVAKAIAASWAKEG
jgi:hypothetical protein